MPPVLALIVVGTGLAFWGCQISETLTAQLTTTLSGSLPDAVLCRCIVAEASGGAGLFLVVKG